MKKMSRIFIGVCLLGVFAFTTTSCKKNENKTSFQVTMPQFTEDEDGRMYIDFADQNLSKWEVGDQIMVYNLNPETPALSKAVKFTSETPVPGNTAHFVEDEAIGEVMGDYYRFFYPASAASGVLDNNREEFVIAPTQNFRKVNGGETVDLDAIKMACAKEVTDGFTFEPITGVFRLKVYGTKAVSSIVVTDDAFNLSGNVSMYLPGVTEEVVEGWVYKTPKEIEDGEQPGLMNLYINGGDSWVAEAATIRNNLQFFASNTGKTMTLNCAEPVQLSTTDFKSFFVALRPQALGEGYTVTVNFSDGTAWEQHFTGERAKCIKPGRIQPKTITVD